MKTNLNKMRVSDVSNAISPDTVGAQQLRTRDGVFKTLGTIADTVIDSAEFTAETVGFAAGRTILATGRTLRAAAEGVMGKPYRHAA